MAWRLILATCALSGVLSADGEFVRRMDYRAPENWEVKKVLGRDLYWHVPRGSTWTKNWDFPDLAMTKHIWYRLCGWFGINDLVEGINLKKPKYPKANWAPADPAEWKGYCVWTNYPAKFTDLLEKTMGGEKAIQGFLAKYPNHPISGWCPDLRPLRWLKPDFDTDCANYQAWKAVHPSFLGFQAFCEYEGEWNKNSDSIVKKSGPEIDARVSKYFPYSDDKRVQLDYTVKVCDHISNFYFGETNFMALASVCPSGFFGAARTGRVRYLQYEAELGSTSGPYALGGIYTRGCSRQYDIPFGWYLATYMHFCYTRDGKNEPGDLDWPYGPARSWTSKTRPYRGAPRSLLNRAAFYGLMIGASSLEMEKWTCFFLETETPDSPIRPSQYMRDFNRIFEINEEIDRGTPYNPVAVLTSVEEGVNRANYAPECRDKWSWLAFFNTLVPLHVDNYESRHYAGNRKKGDVGCLWNSEFGELVDGLCPDADQPTDRFVKSLSDYKAAFLVGWFNRDHFDRAAIERYVRDGGTLFVDSEKQSSGYIDEKLTGVKFAADKTPAADEVKVKGEGEQWMVAFSFGDPYAYHKGTPTTAKPYLVDANGGVIAWANDVGKGRVVTVAVDRMLPEFPARYDWQQEVFKITSCQRTFPLMHYLLREVQGETMPVKVEGDIQWGVNRTKAGWLVWLINNKGVKKFAGEPEELDPKAASTVKVTDKATGKVYEKTIAPGGYGWIEIKELP